ncbi:MAG: sulfatase-like hydrolase/transferase [Planctomycetota bacterium]|nr:sulfatase-like hydrolase/transferase [Planctomycetota bacterium]MDA1113944.1 sulfatase-like hydrolase/transferase [Planctomycetota bacterium]
MKCIFAAVAGATLSSILLVLVGAGWDLMDPMLRERLFLASLNGLFAGWLLGILVHFLGKKSLSRALLIGAAGGFAFASWFIGGLALAVVGAAIMRPFALKAKPMVVLGLALHLLPAAIFFGMRANWEIVPLLPAPELSNATSDQAPVDGSPDVVLIVCDTLRADAILDPEIPTPNLDALRARGAWAPFAEAPANQTLPSHLVLLAGFDIEKIGMRGNYSRWPASGLLKKNGNHPLASRFFEAGYRTAAVVTNPLLFQIKEGSGYQEFEEGFETWHGLAYEDSFVAFMDWARAHSMVGFVSNVTNPRFLSYPLHKLLDSDARRNYRVHYREGERTTDASLRYLEGLQKDDRPFFFLAQYFDPHSPYVPPSEYADTLATEAMTPDGYGRSVTDAFHMRVSLRDDLRDEVVADGGARGAYLHGLYKEEVAYFDEQVGRLIDSVEASGRPTLILFTSDHAEGFGEHRNVEHGETLFEEEYRIPFILAGPGVAPQELQQAPELIDAGFTLLELAGLNTEYFDGRNVLTTDAIAARPRLTVMIDQVALQDGPWLLHATMRYDDTLPRLPNEERLEAEPGVYDLEAIRLFHMVDDPQQNENILQQNPAQVEQMLAVIRERMKMDLYPFIPPRAFSPKEMGALSELGYALSEDEDPE